MPVQETWQPWSKILRAGRTLWRWWWRIKATACTAALTDPRRVARTQSQSPSEALESPRAPSVWTWAPVSTLFFPSFKWKSHHLFTCAVSFTGSLHAGSVQGDRSRSPAVRFEGQTGRWYQGGHQERWQWRTESDSQRTEWVRLIS